MKKRLAALFLLTLLLAASAALAQTVVIPQLHLSLDCPDSYLVYTKGMAPDDPKLSALGLTPADVDASLGANYMEAYTRDWSACIRVFHTEAQQGLPPMETQTDAEIIAVAESARPTLEAAGINVRSISVTRTEQAAFSVMDLGFADETGSMTVRQCMALRDGMFLYIQMRAEGDALTPALEADLAAALRSARFDAGGADRYTDPKTGTAFDWPEGYRQAGETDVKIPGAQTQASFIKEGADSQKIILTYACMDLYAQLPDFQKILYGLDHSGMDSDAMSLEAFKSQFMQGMLGEITEVRYGGNRFIRYDNPSGNGPQMFSMKNGVLYMFQFGRREGDPEFSAFSRTLESVRYGN